MPRKKKYDKTEVVQKAMKAFWNKGYRATTWENLEESMGINPFSIKASFESKEKLFVEVLKAYQEHNEKVIALKLVQSEGNLEDIRSFFQEFVQAVKSGPAPKGCLFANTAAEYSQDKFGAQAGQVKELLLAYFAWLKEVFVQLLEKARDKGQIQPDANPEKYAHYLLGVTEGLAISAKLLSEKALEDYIETSLLAFT